MAKAKAKKGKRKIDGKTYALRATHKTKAKAKRSAADARAKGSGARVFKGKKGYGVYTTKK